MPFTPKFVDLVRNYTSIQGSGAVTLGQPVSGYTGFAAACATGDQFYYCIQGVDRPAEREVGRGTMQANGSIARDPVGGIATNFTKGAKTISLVTAAEWYAKVEAAATGGASVASRALLAAQQTVAGRVMAVGEADRAGLFRFDGGDRSTMVAADPAQAMCVAPASAPGGASGAWLRQHDGLINVRWFGAVGDGVTDDAAAFQAAIDYCHATRVTGFGYGVGGSAGLWVPSGHYYLSDTLEVTHSLHIEGEFVGNGGGGGSVLRWPAGKSGINVQGYGTSGETGFGNPALNGGRVHLQGLYLRGGFNGVNEGAHHGIVMRSGCVLKDLTIDNFAGEGVYSFTSAASFAGNSNCSIAQNVFVQGCRHGFFLDGEDSNAWTFLGCNAMANRGCGFLDSSALGNFYIGCHVATNGDGLAAFPSRAVTSGKRYYVLRGQEAWCAANPPSGTTAHNQGWAYYEDGGTGVSWPAWTNGAPYRCGAGYCADNANNASTFICYSEGDAVSNQFNGQATVIGPMANCVYINGNPFGAQIFGNNGVFTVKGPITCGEIVATGVSHSITASNPVVYCKTTGSYFTFMFQTNNVTDGQLFSYDKRIYVDGVNGVMFRAGGAERAEVTATGLNIKAGNVLSVDGTQVVGPRGASVANATDAASAITQLNALLARCRAHGLIA